jgi:uncharacterized membrane protein
MANLLDFTTIGWVHIIFGILSLITGTTVILTRKGNRISHRFWGYFYLFSMVATNATSLVIYELTGTFNMFHWSALASLIIMTVGMLPVFTKRPRAGRAWLPRHAHFMAGSYLGVILATAAEITSRLPFWDFGVAVGVTVGIGSIIGVFLISKYTPRAIANLNPHRVARQRQLAAAGD